MFSRPSFGIESVIVSALPVPSWTLVRFTGSARSPVGLSPRSFRACSTSAGRSFAEAVSVRGYAGSVASPNSASATSNTESLRFLNTARDYMRLHGRVVAQGVIKHEAGAEWGSGYEFAADYEAFMEGGSGEAGLERDYLFARDGLGNPDVVGGDDEALVDAVVVGLPRCVAKDDVVPLSEALQVAEDTRDTTRSVIGVAGDVRVRAALVRKAGPGEVHDPLPVQVGLTEGVPDQHVLEAQARHREQQTVVAGSRFRCGGWRIRLL